MKKELEKIIKMEDRLEAFMELASLFESCDPQQRIWISEQWDFNAIWDYPNQFCLAQSLKNQRNSVERIRASLLYDAIQGDETDIRERTLGFCLIYQSAKEVGLDPSKLFSEIAFLARGKTSEQIISFSKRDEKDKSINSFCLKRIIESKGVRFELMQ